MDEYYRIARSIIARNNGVWDKTIGGGIMSWFGFLEKNITERNSGYDDGALDAKFSNRTKKYLSQLKIQGEIILEH